MSFGAGDLDRRVSLQRLQETDKNALGEPIVDWVEVAKPWAKVAQMTGAERIAAGGVVASKTRVFEIRHRDDVTADEKWAIDYKGDRYQISAVDPLPGRREGLRLTCVARAEASAS